MKIVFIGAGNVATHLSLAMQKAGHSIIQIYSRSKNSASALANQLNTDWTTKLDDVSKDGDIYIFSLKDDALQSIISRISSNESIWIHTSGSIPMDIFRSYSDKYGVLYPLQTFSKTRKIDFSQIPCFIEANTKATETILYNMAKQLSVNVQILDSAKRKYLHLAAVFACNFTNHMYALASKILENEAIPREVLLPLTDETASKIHILPPSEAQTGPAIRYDQSIINKHLDLLTTPEMKEIYQLISKNIHKESTDE